MKFLMKNLKLKIVYKSQKIEWKQYRDVIN